MKDPRRRNTRFKKIQLLSILLICSSGIMAQHVIPGGREEKGKHSILLQSFNKFNQENRLNNADMSWEKYNYYNAFMGSFCKLDHQGSKASGMAIRMRLGSLNTVNAMEMKLPAWRTSMLEEKRH